MSKWLDGVLQNLETASRIAQRQRMVVLADASARDRVSLLSKDGWIVWEPAPSELLGDDESRIVGLPCLDKNTRAARRERELDLTCEIANESSLADCYAALQQLGDAVGSVDFDHDELLDDAVEDQLSRLWGLFLEATGWLITPEEEHRKAFLARMSDARGAILSLKHTTAPTVLQPMTRTIDALAAFIDRYAAGATTPKADALLAAIESLNPQSIVFGSANDRDLARSALEGLVAPQEIVSVSEMREHVEGERVVACSLMARKTFARFFDPCPASTIALVAYDFEQHIYQSRLERRSNLRKRLSPDLDVKARLTGFAASTFASKRPEPPSKTPDDSPIAIERVASASRKPKCVLPEGSRAETDQTREGRLCRFSGCSWAVFTPNHAVSVLAQQGTSAIIRRTVDELLTGDRLLLREAGDKDVIRLIAEDTAGPTTYAQLWEAGQRWKTALKKISPNPATLWQKLSWLGLHRDPVTIRYWLLDDGMIGPRSQDDISIIVEAAGEQPDDKKWQECWDAIVRLRTLHMRAGMQLTQALEEECSDLMFADFEHEQAVELSLGLLWLVSVQSIQAPAHWPANIVNALHWGREDWRDDMLRNVIVGAGC
ncbi:DrmE family protein [Sphingomonas kaistensis]|uniref:DrmE family protein n=1 Tax=Sphingomonas kaistensis TaxID=298708 RepID=A0ABZ2G075_9SPHN